MMLYYYLKRKLTTTFLKICSSSLKTLVQNSFSRLYFLSPVHLIISMAGNFTQPWIDGSCPLRYLLGTSKRHFFFPAETLSTSVRQILPS